MARTINRLSAAEVAKKTKPGRYGDGGGLWLQVSQFGTKAWLFRFMMDGQARQMGLGSVNTFSLKEARERAQKARQLVADGIDPIAARASQKASARAEDASRLTFSAAAGKYMSGDRHGGKCLPAESSGRGRRKQGAKMRQPEAAEFMSCHLCRLMT